MSSSREIIVINYGNVSCQESENLVIVEDNRQNRQRNYQQSWKQFREECKHCQKIKEQKEEIEKLKKRNQELVYNLERERKIFEESLNNSQKWHRLDLERKTAEIIAELELEKKEKLRSEASIFSPQKN